MKSSEMVTSPCHGVVEDISIQINSRVYEWESLFTIKTDEGHRETVTIGLSGTVDSLEVQVDEEVVPGMVLAYIKEDIVVSGSD